jgi:hypothetical protein
LHGRLELKSQRGAQVANTADAQRPGAAAVRQGNQYFFIKEVFDIDSKRELGTPWTTESTLEWLSGTAKVGRRRTRGRRIRGVCRGRKKQDVGMNNIGGNQVRLLRRGAI